MSPPFCPAPVGKPGFAKPTKSSAFLLPVHGISILHDSPQKIYLQQGICWKIKNKQKNPKKQNLPIFVSPQSLIHKVPDRDLRSQGGKAGTKQK